MRLRLRLITAIWGDEFVRLFTHLCVRSLLAPGNLADLAASHDVRYTILTTEEDAAALRTSELFRRLASTVEVDFDIFSLREIDPSQTISHALLWRRGAQRARVDRETVFLIIPDLIYARGTLTRWANRFCEGAKAIYSPAPLVVLETVLSEIDTRFPGEAEAIDLPAEEAVDIVCRHLHPVSISMFRDSPRRTLHPEEDARAVTGAGFLMRFHTSQPFCFDPSHFRLHESFNPENRLDDIAFEPCSAVSAEPLLKHWDMYYRPWRLDADRVTNIGTWRDVYCTPGNAREAQFPYTFALTDGKNLSPHSVHSAVLESRFLLTQLSTAATIYRIHRKLLALGCHKAAEILAVAHYQGPLRRYFAAKGYVRVLAPEDRAIGPDVTAHLHALFQSGSSRALVDFVLDHALVEQTSDGLAPNGRDDRSTAKAFVTASGRPSPAALREARVISGPHIVDGCEIYIIDHVLSFVPRSQMAQERAAENSAPEPEHVATQPAIAHRPPSWRERAVAEFRKIPRAILVSGVSSIQRSSRALALWLRLRNRLQRTSKGRALIRLGSRFYQVAMLHGFASAMRLTFAWVAPHFAKTTLARLLARVAAVMAGALRELSPQRLRQRIRIASPSIWRTEPAPSPRPGRMRAAETRRMMLLEEIRAVRALGAAQDVLQFYQRRVLGEAAQSPPLRALTNHMTASGMSADRLKVALGDMVAKDREFAEAWLELGYLHADLGDADAALECFRNGAAARQRLPSSPGYRPSRAHAAAELALAAEARGLSEEARSAYERSLAIAPEQSIVRVRYARLLRGLGRDAEAFRQFTAAMEYESPRWPLTKPPRAFSDLATPLLTAEAP